MVVECGGGGGGGVWWWWWWSVVDVVECGGGGGVWWMQWGVEVVLECNSSCPCSGVVSGSGVCWCWRYTLDTLFHTQTHALCLEVRHKVTRIYPYNIISHIDVSLLQRK